MPKFNVTVSYKKSFTKELNVYAADAGEAEEKATDIVNKWDDVEDVEATECEED